MASPIDVSGIEVLSYTGGGVTLLLILRIIYKMVRRDFDEVKESDQKESILDHFKDLAERYKQEATENAKRADTFAEERNRAIEELGKLRSEVVRLTGQIEALDEKIKHLTQTIELMNRVCTKTEESSPGLNS